MAFSFKVEKPKNFPQMVVKLKDEATKHNISFTGDETGGTGAGHGFAGGYEVHPDSITFTVQKKPFIFSEAIIEKKVKEFLVKLDSEIK